SVSRLESKKGTEDALLKSQRRAERLLEEIPAMKEPRAARCGEHRTSGAPTPSPPSRPPALSLPSLQGKKPLALHPGPSS
ncbi:Serum response factor-binding protein 1, partial [Manis javanica]